MSQKGLDQKELERRLAELEAENKKLKEVIDYERNRKPDSFYMGFKETGGDIIRKEPYYDKEYGWVMPEKDEYKDFR